jgi:hypothetical protein
MLRIYFLVSSVLMWSVIMPSRASAQADVRVSARISQIKHTYPCVDSTQILVTTSNKSLVPLRCWLAGMVRAEINKGHAEIFGLFAADSGRLLIAKLEEVRATQYAYDTNKPTQQLFWRLYVGPVGREYPVVFIISQLDDGISVSAWEN